MSTNPVTSLTPIGFAILKALGHYRYLTTNQMLSMGIAKDRGHLGKVLASLLLTKRRENSEERLPDKIGEMSFGVKVGHGRLPRMYWLTKKGALLLEDIEPELAPITYPNRVFRFAAHYDHHVACVDFHIALTRWAESSEQTIKYFHPCFDWLTTGPATRPQPATRLALTHKRIDADALFLLRDPTGIERSFVFELANGIETTRILDKMQHIARGIADRSLNKALNFPDEKAVRILFVFEHRRTAELVQSRAATFTPLRDYLPHFYLKAIDDISADNLQQNWMPLDPQAGLQPLF